MTSYTDDYQTLGVHPGCSLQALKAARRRLVKSWHPDRFTNDASQNQLAEEKIKAINTAFDRLIRHYEKFGTLPDPAKRASAPPVIVAHPQQSKPQETASATSSFDPIARSSRITRFATGPLGWIMFILVVVLAAEITQILLPTDSQTLVTDNPTPDLPETLEPPNLDLGQSPLLKPSVDDYFTLGSTPSQVYAVQGVPTSTEPNVWHYGKSTVYFRDGAVHAWEQDPANPLRVSLRPQVAQRNSRTFTIGSTKSEVRAAQGIPLVETDTMWDYGLSKVYFRNDRVISWKSSPLLPLKVRK